MHTGDSTSIRRRDRRDPGFTLVELLIVIVILGILATVTVFAVRGITNDGQENSEAQELRIMRTATESYTLLKGTVPSSAQDLVDAGLLDEAPGLWTYTDNGDGTYTLTNIRTGDVATSAGGGGGGGGGSTTGVADVITYAGFPAERYAAAGAGFTIAAVQSGGSFLDANFDDIVNAGAPPAGIDLVHVDACCDDASIAAAVAAENPDLVIIDAGAGTLRSELGALGVPTWGHAYGPGSGANLEDYISSVTTWSLPSSPGSATLFIADDGGGFGYLTFAGRQIGTSSPGRTIAVIGAGPNHNTMYSEFAAFDAGSLPGDVQVMYLNFVWPSWGVNQPLQAYQAEVLAAHGIDGIVVDNDANFESGFSPEDLFTSNGFGFNAVTAYNSDLSGAIQNLVLSLP